MDQCLVFCRTRVDCDNLEQYLVSIGGGAKFRQKEETGKENPYSCVVLHSGRSQGERDRNLQTFKDGDVRFLISTDVAARGIDIKALPFVVNMTMPAESEDYIHRVGRVGRADMPGVAISILANQKEKVVLIVWYHKCPSRGSNCSDTRLVEQGGCAIWFDEFEIFAAVEKRLGGIKIPILDQNNLDPNQLKELLQEISRRDPLVAQAEKKVEMLKPKVEELAALETKAQSINTQKKSPSDKKRSLNQRYKQQLISQHYSCYTNNELFVHMFLQFSYLFHYADRYAASAKKALTQPKKKHNRNKLFCNFAIIDEAKELKI
ncbi:hypothetical protein RFI_11476 [Reticulomyxa filosa]|uniref:Helicase C-terminal domain-containing protein n=1 Tax=Reticulomyxa filosa TaxID=46433 RepID=X6NJX7_RETFI|nr:hypothetical protein RFI_11476 [Reticulomyxa filosa]|eukprot:ETO25662.1 hypothetical protein RFI_11476 [Reticulomyxa filosa]